MTDPNTPRRAIVLSVIVVFSVFAMHGALATTVSQTSVTDPGDNEPVPGDTQTVLDLTIRSDDLVKTAGDGSAGDPTASFDDGTTTTPEMYVDDSTSGGYQDGDDVLRLNRISPSSGGGLGGATITDFSTSESYISPAGNAFDGSQAIVDSGDGTLDSTAEIDKDGTAGVLKGLAGTGVQFHEDAAGGAGYDAVDGAYGEAIYDTGGDGTVDGTDTRVTAVTVNSGTDDGDVGTVDLGLSTLRVVGSADVDTGKTLTAAGITPAVAYIDASGDGSFSTGDTVVIDMTGNGQTSDDIILVDNGGFTGGGDAYTGTLTGAWDTIDASSVAFDTGNDGAASVVQPDVVISGGTATIVTAGVTYGVDVGTTNGPVIQYWDSDGNTALGATESVYIDEDDTGTVSSDDANPSDFRLRGFSKTLPAGAVGSTDVDAGISATDFETDEYYLDDDDTGTYANGDAIIVNGGTAANLEAADTVMVTGSISGSARTFSDGTSGDAVMFVGTNDFDGSQDILGVTRVVNGGSDAALSGTTLNNFANDVGYVDTANPGSFDAAETIFQEGDASSGLGTIFGDTVTDITVTNNGTLGTQYISSVSLDIGGTDITSTSSASNGVYAFTGITSNNIVGTGGTSATVTVTLSHDAPAGKTLNFSVSAVADAGTTGTYDSGDTGIFFEQAAPVGDISNGADITIDPTSSLTATGISFTDPTDSDHSKVELAFNSNLDPASTETSDFTVYDTAGDTVSISALEDDDSNGRLVLDLGTAARPVQISKVVLADGAVKTGSGADIPGQSVSVVTTSTTIRESNPTSYTMYVGAVVAVYADSDGNLNEELTVDADTNDDGTYEQFVFEGSTGPNSQLYVFETEGRDTTHQYRFTFDSSDGDPGETATLDLRDLGLIATVDAKNSTTSDTLTGTVSANAGNRDVDVTLYYANNDTIADSTTVTLDGSGEATFDLGQQAAADYYLEATDVGTQETITVEKIQVKSPADYELTFDQIPYWDERGDITNITVFFAANEQFADVYLGGSDVHFQQMVTVTDGSDSDSSVVLQFNSYDRTWDVHQTDADADTLDSVSSPTAVITGSNTAKPLGSASYDLNATVGTASQQTETAVSSLNLLERSTTGLTTWVAPKGADTSTATEITNVGTQKSSTALGDTVIVQVEASGFEGIMAGPDYTVDSLDPSSPNAGTYGVYATVEQTNEGQNQDPKTPSVSDATLVKDLDTNNVYVVFNTGSAGFDFAVDEYYEMRFVVNETSPYVDDTTSAVDKEEFTTSFSINERTTEFTNLNESNYLNLEATDGVEVSGTSTAAPGTIISVTMTSSGTLLKKNMQITVQEDGTWSTSFDLSGYAVGTTYTVSATDATTRDGVIVEAAEEVTTTEPTTELTTTEPTTMEPTTVEPTTGEATTTEQTTEPTETRRWTPGFGIAVAMLALIGVALIALYRKD